MTNAVREPRRQVWHLMLLVGCVFVVLGSHLFSDRPLMVAGFNNVAPAGTVPPGIDVVDDWSAIIHRSDWRPRLAVALGHVDGGGRVRLGWVVREWSFMTLPLAAARQGDLAAFREDAYGYRLVGLTEDQLRLAGTPWFPWWRFAWGWLVIAALAVVGWAEWRWQARRRELLGLI